MKKITVLTYNNYVGIVTHSIILKNILSTICTTDIVFLENINEDCNSNIGIWIQNYHVNLLNNFKTNIFYITEEWFDYPVEDLKKFQYVICMSKYSYNIFKDHCNAVYLPFVSRNFYDPNIARTSKFLHFMGRSIQKNTELILNQTDPITLIDPHNRYRPNLNFNHINTYQTTEQISNLLNSHNIHICCSLYESWGHYLFEGLSTGAEIICSDIPVFKEQLDPDLVHFIPTVEKVDNSYPYCSDNKSNLYKFRKSFFVDENHFKNTIENFKPKGCTKKRIQLYNNIVTSNKKKMLEFFINLI